MAIDEWNDIQHKVKEQVELSRFYLGQNYRQKNVEEKNWNEICVCVVCVCVLYTHSANLIGLMRVCLMLFFYLLFFDCCLVFNCKQKSNYVTYALF